MNNFTKDVEQIYKNAMLRGQIQTATDFPPYQHKEKPVNNFTKEELNSLLSCVVCHWPDSVELIEKLQSMIEKYKKPCEHKWVNMAYAYMQCEKCFVRKGMHE